MKKKDSELKSTHLKLKYRGKWTKYNKKLWSWTLMHCSSSLDVSSSVWRTWGPRSKSLRISKMPRWKWRLKWSIRSWVIKKTSICKKLRSKSPLISSRSSRSAKLWRGKNLSRQKRITIQNSSATMTDFSTRNRKLNKLSLWELKN